MPHTVHQCCQSPSVGILLRKKHFLDVFMRLPHAMQARREEKSDLQRRAAVRIKVQRRETFVMQSAHLPLPDPALLGNRLLVGEHDCHGLQHLGLLTHSHSFAPIPEVSPTCSTFSAVSISSFDDAASSRSSITPAASPRSWFSDDSSDEEGAEGRRVVYGHSCYSSCGDSEGDDDLDFPEDESSYLADDEDLTSDFDVASFVSEHGEQGRWSTRFDTSSSSASSSSSPPRSRSPSFPSTSAHVPFPNILSSPPLSIRTPSYPISAVRTRSGAPIVSLDDFDMILTEEPPSPRRRTRQSSVLSAKHQQRRESSKV